MSSVSILEILPVAIAYNPDFVAFKKKFDDVIEEIEIDACDYEFRRSTRELYEKKSRKMGFLMLELRDYLKKYKNTYGNIVFTGNIYEYCYIRKTNDKAKKYYKDVGSYYIGKLILKENYSIKYFINLYNLRKEKENKITELEPHMDENFIDEYFRNGVGVKDKSNMISYLNDYYDKYNEELGYVIRKKYIHKTLDYKGYVSGYYNPRNLKYWDKTSMITSNKGLKAISIWTYADKNYKCRGNWRFGGITAGDLEIFCKINGFKKEKGKKYQYGDYANWFLHILE